MSQEGIRAVLFDLDNTLVDRKAAFAHFCHDFIDEFFDPQHLPEPKEHMTDYMVKLDQDGYAKKYDSYEKIVKKWNLRITPRECTECHAARFGQYTVLDRDTTRVLDYLAPRYKLGIITNGAARTQHAKIDQAGFRDRFACVIVSGEAGFHKPDVRIFEMACGALGVEPREAVYVGDHFENDVRGALNAGLRAVWYTENDTGHSDGSYVVIRRLAEMMTLL